MQVGGSQRPPSLLGGSTGPVSRDWPHSTVSVILFLEKVASSGLHGGQRTQERAGHHHTGAPTPPGPGGGCPGGSVLEESPGGSGVAARPRGPQPPCSPRPTPRPPAGSREGGEGPGEAGAAAASEALVDAEAAAGDVLQLPGHVVGHADAVMRQHLQHEPQVQPPLLPGHAVPAAGRGQGSGAAPWGPRPGVQPGGGGGGGSGPVPPAPAPRTGSAQASWVREARGWPWAWGRGSLVSSGQSTPLFRGTHSKSVSFLSSVTGLKATAFFCRPMTQAESGALANTRPVDTGSRWQP